MSEDITLVNESAESKKAFFRELKDRLLFIGWIGGLVLMGSLLWILSKPILSSYLQRSVNQSMEASGLSVRISAAQSLPPVKQIPLGMWYSVYPTGDLFFVFPVFQDGVLDICGAILSPENKVTQIVPVSAHACQVYGRIAPGIISMYTRRIENAAAQWRNNE